MAFARLSGRVQSGEGDAARPACSGRRANTDGIRRRVTTDPLDRQYGMQFDAASGSADLKVIHVEEPDPCHAHGDAAEIIEILCTRLTLQVIEHTAGGIKSRSIR